jgi:hypothetical protein
MLFLFKTIIFLFVFFQNNKYICNFNEVNVPTKIICNAIMQYVFNLKDIEERLNNKSKSLNELDQFFIGLFLEHLNNNNLFLSKIPFLSIYFYLGRRLNILFEEEIKKNINIDKNKEEIYKIYNCIIFNNLNLKKDINSLNNALLFKLEVYFENISIKFFSVTKKLEEIIYICKKNNDIDTMSFLCGILAVKIEKDIYSNNFLYDVGDFLFKKTSESIILLKDKNFSFIIDDFKNKRKKNLEEKVNLQSIFNEFNKTKEKDNVSEDLSVCAPKEIGLNKDFKSIFFSSSA